MFSKVRSAVYIGALTLVAAASAQAQIKVAIINAQKAVADTQEIQAAQKVLQEKYKARQQQVEDLQRDLQSLQQQLRAPNLPPDKEALLQGDFTRKQKELQRVGEDLQSDVNHDREEILGKTGRQMQEVVRKLAEEKGLDVIIDVTNTIYFKPTLDMTPEATVAYNKAYPVPVPAK
jgi:outer membrane protein